MKWREFVQKCGENAKVYGARDTKFRVLKFLEELAEYKCATTLDEMESEFEDTCFTLALLEYCFSRAKQAEPKPYQLINCTGLQIANKNLWDEIPEFVGMGYDHIKPYRNFENVLDKAYKRLVEDAE